MSKRVIPANMVKLLPILLLLILCCLFTACNKSIPTSQVTEVTDEFSSFLNLRKVNATDVVKEISEGYEFTLENGRLSIISADNTEIWSSDEKWYVDSFRTGDINDDRLLDFAFVVWKSYGFEEPQLTANEDPSVLCHMFVYSIEDNNVKPLWCSPELPRPIYSFELTNYDEQTQTPSGAQLVTWEGAYTEDYSKTIAKKYIYDWNSLGFTITDLVEKLPEPEPVVLNATLAAVGDLMCHEPQYKDALTKGGGEQYDFNYAFKHIAGYISAADFAIGNFETTVIKPEKKPTGYPRFGTPASFPEAIKAAGFDFLSTANNHSLDTGKDGLLYTIQVLDELELGHTGTYATESASQEIDIVNVNGITFAILSYTYGTNGIPIPADMPWCINDAEKIKKDITRAKEMNPDFIIVMPHTGVEYETTTRQIYKDQFNEYLKAGADIVLASHPHVLQPAEFVTITDEDGTKRKCFIAYSLGNFISAQRTHPRDYGMIVNLSFSKVDDEKATIDSVELMPTWVKYLSPKGTYDITILPVNELDKPEFADAVKGLRPVDVKRIEDVKKEFAEMFNELISDSETEEAAEVEAAVS